MSCPEESTGPPVDFINRLDDLCLDKILGYLSPLQIPKMGEVCKRWRKMSQNAWHNIKMVNTMENGIHLKRSDTKLRRILLHCGRYLKELSLYDCFTSSIIMPVIKRNCLNLETLRVELKDSYERDFLGAFQYMEKLRRLDIFIENYIEGNDWPDHVSARILESVPAGIEDITFQEGFLETEPEDLLILTDLPVVLERLNNLSHLTIKHCQLETDALAVILQKIRLVWLEFDHCHLATTTSFESNLVNLRQLYLECSNNVNGILHSSAITSQDLKSLNLEECHISRAFGADIAKFKNLEDLNLRKVECLSDTDFIKITRECKKLKNLELQDLKNVSSTALEAIGQLKNLKYLVLPTENVNNQVIISVAHQCTNLTSLSLNSHDDNVTATSFKALGNLVNLEYLSFPENNNVDNTVIMNIANNCSKLESLNLYGAKNVTDSSIMDLIKMCNCLSYLTVRKSQITVASLICAAEETKHRQKKLRFCGFSQEIVKVFKELDIKSPFLEVSAW